MFDRRRSKEIEDFAIALAREFAARFPPTAQAEDARTAAQLARAIDELCARAASYQRRERLGMFRRAKFGTAFKLELKHAGYPPELVDGLTQRLLLAMARP
ncbi:MAG: hypothetical protein RML56_09665 [Burkholderiales bacterium]|nr:hypothetical protein [Burkholderiales bacterium]